MDETQKWLDDKLCRYNKNPIKFLLDEVQTLTNAIKQATDNNLKSYAANGLLNSIVKYEPILLEELHKLYDIEKQKNEEK